MKVGVIMGGTSSEKEVSIMTGKEMVAQLDTQNMRLLPLL